MGLATNEIVEGREEGTGGRKGDWFTSDSAGLDRSSLSYVAWEEYGLRREHLVLTQSRPK